MLRPLLACALGLALVVPAAAAPVAHAAPTWLDEELPFGDVPSRQSDARAAMAPDGTIVFARFAPDGALEVRERPPGGPIGATITIPPVAVDPQPSPNLQVLVGADGTAAVPRLTSVSIPPDAAVDETLPFSVSGLDVWSGPLRTAAWDFGDGSVAGGLFVAHAYATGGLRTVNVRAEDGSGNATTASTALTVAGEPTTPVTPAPAPSSTVTTPPRDTRAPVVSGVSINPVRPRAGRPPTLVLSTDEVGTLRVVLAGTAPDVRSGGRCVARSRGYGRTRCTRALTRHDVSRALAAGTRRVTLPRLPGGLWTVTATVTDAAGNRSTRTRLTVRVT